LFDFVAAALVAWRVPAGASAIGPFREAFVAVPPMADPVVADRRLRAPPAVPVG
jgi:hypothetical protein